MESHPDSLMNAFLRGDLDAERTRAVLDHVRGCERCRERLEASAHTAARAQVPPPEEEAPRSRRRMPRRLLVSMMILSGVAILALRGGLFAPEAPQGADLGGLVAQDLAAGRPVLRWLGGDLDNRPRVVECLLPPGATTTELKIEDGDGTLLWTFAHPSLVGLLPEEGVVLASGRELAVTRVYVPFPGPEALPIPTGEERALRVAVSGESTASRPVGFRIRP